MEHRLIQLGALDVDQDVEEPEQLINGASALPVVAPDLNPLEVLVCGEVQKVLEVPADRRPILAYDGPQSFKSSSPVVPKKCFR